MRTYALSLLAVTLIAIATPNVSAGEWGFSYHMDHGPAYGPVYSHPYHHGYHPPVRHVYVEPPCYEPYGYVAPHYHYRPAYRPPVYHHHYHPHGHYYAPRPSIHLSFGH